MAWKAYRQWRIDHGLSYVSHAMFGRLAHWPKERSGNVWYIDCELVEKPAKLSSATKPKALPRLGIMAKGSPPARDEPVTIERG